jgi:hypothetical protein
MPGPDLGFDDRNLPAAARDSCHLPFPGKFLERAAIAFELGSLAAERLPPLNDYVYILGIQFDAEADTLGEFCGSQSGPRTQERVVDQFATL